MMSGVTRPRRTIKDRAIGTAMRTYRRSPLYPQWGERLASLLSRIPGTSRTAQRTIDGVVYELDLSEVIDASLYYSGTFELETERAIVSLVRPGGIAIDVGANIGYHTFRMAAGVDPGGLVLAVEPMTTARTRLSRNLELNPRFDNIIVSAVAASDADGLAEVAFQSSFRLNGEADTSREVVELRTIDSLVRDHGLPRVDFIKVDVDGFEAKVFRGAAETLRRWLPDIVFEISPSRISRAGDDADAMLEQLRGLGYDLRHEDGGTIEDLPSILAGLEEFTVNLRATARAGS